LLEFSPIELHPAPVLLGFHAKNYRSILHDQTLSLLANGRDPNLIAQNTIPIAIPGMKGWRALKAIAIYGANASGKSNLLSALRYLRHLVLNSAQGLRPKDPTGVIAFARPSGANQQPTELGAAFIHSGTRYEFEIVLDANRILEESLIAYPEGRKQTWYARKWAENAGAYRYSPETSSVFQRDPKQEEFTRPNALFLSTAVQLNNLQLQPVVDWFRDQLRFGIPTPSTTGLSNTTAGADDTLTLLRQDGPDAAKIRTLLRHADFGITHARAWRESVQEEIEDEEGEKYLKHFDQDIVEFRHQGPNGQHFELRLNDESAGTRRFFALAGPWLKALEKGTTVCLDEFDTSFHPFMTQALLELAMSENHNQSGAQILFTTHNPVHLNMALLRRDQIWFVDKDASGATFIYPLTDYQPRNKESLVRGYLSGRYGAIPFIPNRLLDEPTREIEASSS